MITGPTWKQLVRAFVLLLGGFISALWGFSLEHGSHGGVMGFPGIYYGTRCLMEHCDPYNPSALQTFYEHKDASSGADSEARRQSVTLYVNLPTTFLFVAPFAILPLAIAQTLWTLITVGCFCLATFLMWQLGSSYAPNLSVLLAFVMLSNCEIIFSGGNTAGVVVGLCVIAVWCFLQQRLVAIGVLCLAASLAIKPHDAGLIWLYFLIASRPTRRNAIRSGALAIALAIVAGLWVSVVAPHWMPELRENLAAISAPGGINEPGPASIGVSSPDMIIDLQTVISCFVAVPQIYNLLSYLICVAVFVPWLLAVVRLRPDGPHAFCALVSASALSMLVTYHRSYDSKLLLLAIPACAYLWSNFKHVRWWAFGLTMGGILITGDIPMAAWTHLTSKMLIFRQSVSQKILFAFVARPVPLILLALAVFYISATIRLSPRPDSESAKP